MRGGDGAGVLRSRDLGRTWEPANQGFSEKFVSRITFDPSAGRVLASVWGDRKHGGVFSAPTPQGRWTRLGEGLKGREVVSLAVAGGQALAGTDEGLFRLGPTDTMWRQVVLKSVRSDREPRVIHLEAGRGGVVLAGASTGLFRSEDSGLSFRPVLTGVATVGALTLAREGGLSFAATSVGLYESRDEGRTWTAARAPLTGVRVNALLAPSGSDVVLAASSHGLYRSMDGGASFVVGGHGLPDSDFTSLALTPDGRAAFVSDFTWGGLYRSEDLGLRWTRVEAFGLVTDRIWTMAVSPKGSGDLIVAPAIGGLHVAKHGVSAVGRAAP